MSTRSGNIFALFISLGICLAAGAIGGLSTASSVGSWYAGLNKPSFSPPGWIFGPVWTTLYILMGVAAWLVWLRRAEHAGVKLALAIFVIQLALNLAWSYLFFGLRSPLAAFVDLVALWLAILITIVAFGRILTAAAALLIPYLLWVSFAGVLNFTIWHLNR